MTEHKVTAGVITLALRDASPLKVRGWRGTSVGAYQAGPRVWRLTHLPSGLGVCKDDLATEEDALTLLELLDPLLPATGELRDPPPLLVQKQARYLALGWMFANGYFDED